MRIAEIYHSVQGEGQLAGTPSIFIRASGCNLRCWFCDTPYASWNPEGHDLAVDEISSRCEEWDTEHIVITGGEPMLFSEMLPLCDRLHKQGRHITIETAGTLYLPVVCDLMSLSPKLIGSAPDKEIDPRWHRRHERDRHQPEVVQRLVRDYEYQLKFVIDTPDDLPEVKSYLNDLKLRDKSKVYLMPQGTAAEELSERASWLEPYCAQHRYRFCPRLQIEWFGAQPGT